MDGQKTQVKLTRTQSSLLRSSPTVRSSMHSVHSIVEEDFIRTEAESDDEEQKKTKKPWRSGLSIRAGSTFLTSPILALPLLVCFVVFSLYFLSCFFYLREEELPISEKLLLGLIFIAITLFLGNKNKVLIQRTVYILKHTFDENAKRLGFPKTSTKPVQWYIGNSNSNSSPEKEKNIIREGVELYSNGDFYEGEFHRGKCTGSGVYNFFVGGRYEGDWVDGKYDGYGIESWAKGSRYRGQYRQGLRHGFGVYRFYTGDSYAGEWSNGQSHGVGVQTCSDGSCYMGEFKCGLKHGLGSYYFRNGDRYAGEYFGDKIHGFGVYHFANGHCYEGSWHESGKHGYGKYTFLNGENKCGEWDTGGLKHPLPPLTEAVLRAVQAARKTAESAVNLRRVDDEVNKAVIAANRAATAARVAAVKAVQNQMNGMFCDTVV